MECSVIALLVSNYNVQEYSITPHPASWVTKKSDGDILETKRQNDQGFKSFSDVRKLDVGI